MKKLLLIIAVVAVIAGCNKKEIVNNNPVDIWNGYGDLKSAEPTATLYAGQTINVGTVTYGLEEIDGVGYFTATYNLTGGWTMSESHLYVGSKEDMPLNKPGNPQIGHFPYSAEHDPWVSTYTYEIPLSDLPSYNDFGFTTSAHAIVHGPNGQTETAFRYDDDEFPGKRWGWYGTFYYQQNENPFYTLYGTEQTSDGSLNVYLINLTTGQTEQLIGEVNLNEEGFDGTAYDDESGYFFFVGSTSNTLYGMNLNEGESTVETLGTLDGPTQSATIYNGSYYYVDANTNELVEVTFDNSWQISSQTVVSTVPSSVAIEDITFSPDGSNLYMVGSVSGASSELITLDVAMDFYATLDIPVNSGSQIAYGSDDNLYVIESSPEDGGSIISTIDPETGTVNQIDTNDVVPIDPFSDLAGGPIM